VPITAVAFPDSGFAMVTSYVFLCTVMHFVRENTCFQQKSQFFNNMYGNNLCLLWESCGKHRYTVWAV